METKTITKEESKIEIADGVESERVIEVEYIQKTIPEKIEEYKKDDYIAQKEASLAFYQAEVVRNQEMVDGIQAELDALNTPSVK